MKRIMHFHTVSGFVFAAALVAASAATAVAASNPTPTPTSAVVTERVFNDCPTSTLTTVNNYPSLISFDDQNVDCFGFANLHVWRFSADGTNEIAFDNNASYRFSATFKIEGTGNGEGGLQIAPWWSHNADGLFNVRSTDGEIAVFGGRLPFYSFTNAPHNLHYVKGQEIGLEMVYEPRALNVGRPGTVEYRVTYGGNTYTSGALAYDMGNPLDPPHGLWGALDDARVGGHFKAFLGQGNPVGVKASFTDIKFATTPNPNAAFLKTRVFNDCPTSTLATVNNYPALISFDDQNLDCFGFANLHVWRFSENGGTDAAIFNNNSQFRFSADFKIEGSGNGEGGLQIAPWWSHDADGLFNVRSTDGEIAVFGGRLPFFSFTNAPNNLHYVKGETINLEMIYSPNGRTAASPATVEYRVKYQGNSYSSGPLAFDEANPAEDPPFGLYGMLNDGQAGGHFKAFLGQGNPVSAKATFSNIAFSTCDYPVAVNFLVLPSVFSANSKFPYVFAIVFPPSHPADFADIQLNGLDPLWSGNFFGIEVLKFDRSDLAATVTPGVWSKATLTGTVNGECFEGTSKIKVIAPCVTEPAANAIVSGGGTQNVAWTTPADVSAPVVDVYSSVDNGQTWQREAAGIPNTGHYTWDVPNVSTSNARISIQKAYAIPGADPMSAADVAESNDFTISRTVGVTPQGSELALYGATPNPGRGLNVSFSLPNSDPATIAVYDVSGRQVRFQDIGQLGPGRHSVSLASAGRLPVGIYMVRMIRGSTTLSSRAVVIE